VIPSLTVPLVRTILLNVGIALDRRKDKTSVILQVQLTSLAFVGHGGIYLCLALTETRNRVYNTIKVFKGSHIEI
jgi:hypothetical protein